MYAGPWKNYQEYADATDPDLIAQRAARRREREEYEAEKAEYLAEVRRDNRDEPGEEKWAE